MLNVSTAPIQNMNSGLGIGRSPSLRAPISRQRDLAPIQRPHSMLLPAASPFSVPQFQDIQPKPSTAATTGTVRPPSLSGEPPKKRRGRPPKAETEMRRAAQARANLPPLQPRRDPNVTSPTQASVTAAQAAQAVMTPSLLTGSRGSHTSGTVADHVAEERRRARLESLETARRYSEEEEAMQARLQPVSAESSMQRSPTRGYPDILSRDPQGGSSSFRAPRGGQ